MDLDPRLPIALGAALGMALVVAGVLRWQRRRSMRSRVRALADEWTQAETESSPVPVRSASDRTLRGLANTLGVSLGRRLPGQVGTLTGRVERAGLGGKVSIVELLGWKALGVSLGTVVGVLGVLRYGAGGLVILALSVLIGWFGVDFVLARKHASRRRSILRDLPTVMDLLVLSLEAGMGLDRALRTVEHEYHSALSDELRRVLADIDLGLSRGEAFGRMARRVGLEDLQSLSRAIVQSEDLGVSMVGVMQSQGREVRMSRRRAAEAQALEAPVKMLIPLVVFILPTLFMLLLGPVGLRAGAAFSGAPAPP